MDAHTRSRLYALRDELEQLQSKSNHTPTDLVRVAELSDEILGIGDRVELQRKLDGLGTVGPIATPEGRSPGMGLAEAILRAGWDRQGRSAVMIPNVAIETKAGSVTGGVADTVPSRFRPAGLGLDERYLYPRIRTVTVPADATSVQTYRQLSRTLGSPATMIRAIDSVAEKTETNTVAEPFSADLKMIATISSGTPNILLANQGFREWVDGDLLAAYRNAVDVHIVSEIDTAVIGMGGDGVNAFEDILLSQEVVRAAGYQPDLVVVSPADALAVELLVMSAGDHYAFAQQLPDFVVTNAVADGEGFVADSSALGTLFLGPFTFATFEENSGSTNSSTVRAESSGRFVVQRPFAAATLGGGS